MNKKTHRYSFLISPLIVLIDMVFIYIFSYFLSGTYWNKVFIIAVSLWLVTSYFTKFYIIKRTSRPSKIVSKSLIQFFVFDLEIIAFYKFAGINISNKTLLLALLSLNLYIIIFKLLSYTLIKFYRSKKKNTRNYVIAGYNEQTREFKELLSKRKDYGYKFKGFLSNKKIDNDETLSDISSLEKILKKNNIDVIFCSLKNMTDREIKEIVQVANNHFVSVKFIPDTKQVLKYKHNFEYFDYFPVLVIQKSPLDKPENRFLKRAFDIIFSLLVTIFILSWLTSLLWILIKLESKGPLFFKQKRNGINYQPFECYKFRSMRPNREADLKQVSKDDNRVTTIGKFIRKTSIDELPQFFNVLKGDMSVVGPRPHMVHENERFRQRVEKFMGRHYVKPGITGLAQVKGYRGEVINDEDIINRIKYDLFYIENWSFWLDLKIILFTVLNIFKGEEKAY